jgi:hypothetical protein
VAGVILLDTNQLEQGQPPDGTLLAMLQTLANQTGHGLGLPEIAFEEHLTHYRQALDLAERNRRRAIAEITRLIRSARTEEVGLDIDHEVADRRSRLRSVFQIVSTPDWASREALLREARRLPPAKVSPDGPGAGGRDAAIWLTAIAACQTSGEHTYFVSADFAAFGRELKPELASDLDNMLGDRASLFQYCGGLDVLLATLATKLEGVPGAAQIGGSEAVQAAVKTVLADPTLVWEFPLMDSGLVGVETDAPQLAGTAGRVVCYQIGDTTWASARPTWQAIVRLERVAYGPHGMEIDPPREWTFKISTTLVMQLDREGAISSAEVAARSQAFGFEEQVPEL